MPVASSTCEMAKKIINICIDERATITTKKNHPIKKTWYTYVRLKDVFRILFTKLDGGKNVTTYLNFVAAKLILFLYIQTITVKMTLRQYEMLHARFNIHFQNFKYPF
jgi:(2Fe-2S) ferredoxin